MTLFRQITLATFPAGKRKLIIGAILASGYLFLLSSTFIFTFSIPHTDSQIFDFDGKIADAQNVFTQYQLTESMQWTPYNLVKMIDINPEPHPEIKLRFTSQMKITMMTSLILLSWPESPSPELRRAWDNMNFIDMENVKRGLFKTFSSYLSELHTKRSECFSSKQSLVRWATLIQILGLALTSVATSLQALHKS